MSKKKMDPLEAARLVVGETPKTAEELYAQLSADVSPDMLPGRHQFYQHGLLGMFSLGEIWRPSTRPSTWQLM